MKLENFRSFRANIARELAKANGIAWDDLSDGDQVKFLELASNAITQSEKILDPLSQTAEIVEAVEDELGDEEMDRCELRRLQAALSNSAVSSDIKKAHAKRIAILRERLSEQAA